MQTIGGRRRRQQRRLRQASEQKRHPAQVEKCVVPRQRGWQHRSGIGRDQLPIGNDHHEGQLFAEGQLGRGCTSIDKCRRDKAPENTRCRVLGVTVLLGGDGERVVRPGGGRSGRSQRGRRTKAPRDGDLRAHGHGDAVVAEDRGRDTHSEMRCVVTEAGTLSFGVDARERRALHFDLDVAIQRDGECIESRPQVRR